MNTPVFRGDYPITDFDSMKDTVEFTDVIYTALHKVVIGSDWITIHYTISDSSDSVTITGIINIKEATGKQVFADKTVTIAEFIARFDEPEAPTGPTGPGGGSDVEPPMFP